MWWTCNGDMGWWAVWGGILFWGAVIGVVAWAVWTWRQGSASRAAPALEVARERYARGEISREEF